MTQIERSNSDQDDITMSGINQWLNPPTDTWPEPRVLLDLDPAAARIAAETFAAAAEAFEGTDREQACVLHSLARQVTLALLTPEEADKRDPDRFDTMHPANQMSRLFNEALRQFARWSGPVSLSMNALNYSAAIAASRDGEDGVREVIRTARRTARALESSAWGPLNGPVVGPVGPVSDDSNPAPHEGRNTDPTGP